MQTQKGYSEFKGVWDCCVKTVRGEGMVSVVTVGFLN